MTTPRYFRVRPRVFLGAMLMSFIAGGVLVSIAGILPVMVTKRPDDLNTPFKMHLTKPPPAVLAAYNRSKQPKSVIAKVKPVAPPVTAIASNEPEIKPAEQKAPVKITYEGNNHS